MNALFGETIGLRQVAQALARRIPAADCFVAMDLFLRAIGTKAGWQGNALVEPSKDPMDSL
jgi:hypothetical protein